MSYLNSDQASRDVHIWSDRRHSMPLRWHKMWEGVKDAVSYPVNVSLIAATDAGKQGSASRLA